jgi:hypothetical protein
MKKNVSNKNLQVTKQRVRLFLTVGVSITVEMDGDTSVVLALKL